jgi:hypothetical protein
MERKDRMAERIIVICDVCGEPASTQVTLKAPGHPNAAKDVCGRHEAELFKNTHTPKRGRKRATVSDGARKSTRRKSTARRRRKAVSA